MDSRLDVEIIRVLLWTRDLILYRDYTCIVMGSRLDTVEIIRVLLWTRDLILYRDYTCIVMDSRLDTV